MQTIDSDLSPFKAVLGLAICGRVVLGIVSKVYDLAGPCSPAATSRLLFAPREGSQVALLNSGGYTQIPANKKR